MPIRFLHPAHGCGFFGGWAFAPRVYSPSTPQPPHTWKGFARLKRRMGGLLKGPAPHPSILRFLVEINDGRRFAWFG